MMSPSIKKKKYACEYAENVISKNTPNLCGRDYLSHFEETNRILEETSDPEIKRGRVRFVALGDIGSSLLGAGSCRR